MDKQKVRKYFDLSFTALANTPDDVFDFFYEDALPKLPKNRWRSYWVEGTACLIAHAIAMRNIGAGLGENGEPKLEKTSKTIGKMSVGYGAKVSDAGYADAGEYAMTIYGRRFYDVRKKVVTVGFIV